MISPYPEHEKLAKVQGQSQVCGEFLDWLLETKQYRLAYRSTIPIADTQDLLAEFFKIDQDKIAAEKDQMIAEIRKQS